MVLPPRVRAATYYAVPSANILDSIDCIQFSVKAGIEVSAILAEAGSVFVDTDSNDVARFFNHGADFVSRKIAQLSDFLGNVQKLFRLARHLLMRRQKCRRPFLLVNPLVKQIDHLNPAFDFHRKRTDLLRFELARRKLPWSTAHSFRQHDQLYVEPLRLATH